MIVCSSETHFSVISDGNLICLSDWPLSRPSIKLFRVHDDGWLTKADLKDLTLVQFVLLAMLRLSIQLHTCLLSFMWRHFYILYFFISPICRRDLVPVSFSPRMRPFCMALEWSISTIMPFSGEYKRPLISFVDFWWCVSLLNKASDAPLNGPERDRTAQLWPVCIYV